MNSGPVRKGHLASLRMLQQSDAFRGVLDMYEGAVADGVYLRPSNNGLTALVLSSEAPKFLYAGRIKTLPTTADLVEQNVELYKADLSSALKNPKPEEIFSLGLLRSALGSGLRLPESDLLFIVQEWRFPTEVGGKRLDLLAVDPSDGRLVVVELKQDSELDSAADQAKTYVEFLQRFPELPKFFAELFEAMKGIYAPDSAIDRIGVDAKLSPRAEVWSPERRMRVPSEESRASAAIGLGPQVKKEAGFIARMRLHQSWWRARGLEVPWGTGPLVSSTAERGSMLRTEDADAGKNFLTESIHQTALRRISEGSGVESYRCTHNLLSSQPMCFNLFGPLVEDHDLALELLSPLLPIPASAITSVRIEYAPQPKKEYLDDGTAFDAFIEFRDEQGEAAFVGIETKLTEPFSDKLYEKPRYRELTEPDDSPWQGSPAELADPRWNQLWRNQLLVEATRKHPTCPHGNRGWLALVAHPEDPDLGESVAGYRPHLASQDSLLEWPLDKVVAAFRTAASSEDQQRWLNDFEDRYLNLRMSE